jgi:hypothetical protein
MAQHDFVPSLEVSLRIRTFAIFGRNLRRAQLQASLIAGDLARRAPTIRGEQARRLAGSMKRQFGAFCPPLEERDAIELMRNANAALGRSLSLPQLHQRCTVPSRVRIRF